MDRILDEQWADREVRRNLFRHFTELCLTRSGYAMLIRNGINIKGDNYMSDPILFKAEDGSVQQVVESETLTLEDLDTRISEAEQHVQFLKNLRVQVDVLQNGADATSAASDAGVETTTDQSAADGNGNPVPAVDTTTPAPEAPAAPADPAAPAAGGVDLQVTPGDQPVVPAAPADAATAANNNGQVNPADSSNPTPPVPPVVPQQPIVGA